MGSGMPSRESIPERTTGIMTAKKKPIINIISPCSAPYARYMMPSVLLCPSIVIKTSPLCILSLDGQRDSISAAETERGETTMNITPLHLVEHRCQQAGARLTDGVAQCDRAAI